MIAKIPYIDAASAMPQMENTMSIYAILLIYAGLIAWFAYEVYRAPLMESGDE